MSLIYVLKCAACGKEERIDQPDKVPFPWHRFGRLDVCSWQCLSDYALERVRWDREYIEGQRVKLLQELNGAAGVLAE
jgi:hypothetical protein